jgi:hypothetical protein
MSLSAVEILKKQMREKFPQAHGFDGSLQEEVASFGSLFDVGMFPAGSISEVIPAGRFSGISLMVAGLLENEGVPEAGGLRMVLVDGADGFDPGSFSDDACGRMLWVRCGSAMEMVKAADLLVHDGNMPFILLDAMGLDRRDLEKVPASAWWRLRQVVERTGGRLVVMSERPVVPCASLRVALGAGLKLEDFDAERGELLARLEVSNLKSQNSRRSG